MTRGLNWPGGKGAAGPPWARSTSMVGRIWPVETLFPTPALHACHASNTGRQTEASGIW